MGNKIARTTQASATEYYLHDLPSTYNLVLLDVVSRGRFLKSVLCKHDEGLLLVKVYFKRAGEPLDLKTWSELPESQMTGAPDALQTPGAMSSRLSFGMTPKTVRLPKNGEMLLSVHGSPLGVYEEENLAAIKESGNGSDDAAS